MCQFSSFSNVASGMNFLLTVENSTLKWVHVCGVSGQSYLGSRSGPLYLYCTLCLGMETFIKQFSINIPGIITVILMVELSEDVNIHISDALNDDKQIINTRLDQIQNQILFSSNVYQITQTMVTAWPLDQRMFSWNLMMTVSVVKRGHTDTMVMSTTIVKQNY